MDDISYEPIRRERILGFDPVGAGFGFVILEIDPLQLVDWGVARHSPNATEQREDAVRKLLELYEPTAIVLEDVRETRLLRRNALNVFTETTAELLSQSGVPVYRYSRQEIRLAFERSGEFTKHGIAKVLAAQFPELESRLPRPRKVWESEDPRMSIFDALSLVITRLVSSRPSPRDVARL